MRPMKLGKRIWKREGMGRPIEQCDGKEEGGHRRTDHYGKDGSQETGEKS